ncbi:MAG: hypothetical protein IJI10_09355 [Eubacterium sp.]|nr:hypothetical protein [Eubacterium sp.]
MKNRIAAWLMTAVLAVTTVGADASIVFADNPDVAAESVVESAEEVSAASEASEEQTEAEPVLSAGEAGGSDSDAVQETGAAEAAQEETAVSPAAESETVSEDADSDDAAAASEAASASAGTDETVVETQTEQESSPAMNAEGVTMVSEINGESVYLLYTDDEEGQMIQANGNYYYYGFLPQETGYYTVYLSGGQITYGQFCMLDADGNSVSYEYTDGRTKYYDSFPGSLTCKLTEGNAVYFRIYCNSNNGSKSRVKIKKKTDPEEVTLQDVQIDTAAYAYGKDLAIRVKLNQSNYNAVEASIRDASNSTSCGNDNAYPQKADANGYYTLNWSDFNISGDIYLDSIRVYDQYGYYTNVTIPATYTDTALFSVSQLQNELNQLAENDGGTYTCSYYTVKEGETLTIPEGVTLDISNMYVSGTLSVKGKMIAYYLNMDKDAVYSDDGGTVVVRSEYSDYAGYNPATVGFTGYYNACYYDRTGSYSDVADLEWRHGKWREPLEKRNGIPEDDEIMVLDSYLEANGSFNTSGQSDEPNYDTHWFRYTPEKDTLITLTASIGDASWGNFDTYVKNESGLSCIIGRDYNAYDRQSYTLSLTAGKTFYFYIEANGSNVTYSFDAELQEGVLTASKVAAALDFANASYSVTDLNTGLRNRKITVTIPVNTENEAVLAVLDGSGGNQVELCFESQEGRNYWIYGELDTSRKNLVLSQECDVYSVASDEIQLVPRQIEYVKDNSWQYIYNSENENAAYLAGEAYTDFGDKIDPIKVTGCKVDADPMTLNSEIALTPGTTEVYAYTAVEKGSYTAYLTDAGACIDVTVIYGGENGGTSRYGNNDFPYSAAMDLDDGDTVYIVAQAYDNTEAAPALGLTADTGEIAVNSITLNETAAVAGQTVSMNVSCSGTKEDGKFRRAEAYFTSAAGYSFGISAEANRADQMLSQMTLTGSTSHAGSYKLNYITIYDYYGRNHTYYNGDIEGIDFADYFIDIQSVNDYLNVQAEAGVSDVTLDYVQLNTESEDLVIPEGMTVTINQIYVESNFRNLIVVNGTLKINSGDVYLGVKESLFSKGANGSIILTGSICANPPEKLADTSDTPMITGVDSDSRIYGWSDENGYIEYVWRNGLWKQQRSDGYADLEDMIELVQQADGSVSWSSAEMAPGEEIWFKFKVNESGLYKVNRSGMSISEILVAREDNDYSHVDGYSSNGTVYYLAAGEQIVLRTYKYDDDDDEGENTTTCGFSFTKESEQGITGETLAADLDVDNIKINAGNSTAESVFVPVEITIPLKGSAGGVADLYNSIGEGAYFSVRTWLNGENYSTTIYGSYNASSGNLELSQNVAIAGREADTLRLSEIEIEVEGNSGWRTYMIENQSSSSETDVQTHSTRYGYANISNAVVSLPAGPELTIDSKTGKFTAYTNINGLYYSFTPEESGYYYLDTDYQDLDWEFDFYEWHEEYSGWEDCSRDLTAGKTYRIYFGVWDESEDHSRPTGTPIDLKLSVDNAEVELTSVTLPETTYESCVFDADVKVSVKNGEITYGYLYFGKDPYDDEGSTYYNDTDSVRLKVLDGGTLKVDRESIYTAGEWELYEVVLYGRGGKTLHFRELDGIVNHKTLTVGTLKERLESAKSGDVLDISYLGVNSGETVTIQEGVTVNSDYVFVDGDAELLVYGTLNVNDELEINNTVEVGNQGRIKAAWVHMFDGGINFAAGASAQITNTFSGYGAEDTAKWEEYRAKITGADGAEMYPRYYDKEPVEDGYYYTYDTSLVYRWNGSAWVLAGGEEPEPDPVEKTDISSMAADFALAVEEVTYTGSAQKPDVTYSGTNGLLEGRDYSVAYKSNKDAGTATVTITGINSYTGSITKNFTINKAERQLIPESTAIQKSPDAAAFTIDSNAWGTVTYTSKDTNVAEITADGKIQPKAHGETTITMTVAETPNYKAATAEVTLTVLKKASVLKALDLAWNLGAGTADNKLDISGRFRYNGTTTDTAPADLVYASSDEAVVTVDENGTIKGVGTGTAEISIYAAQTEDYDQSNTVKVPVNVKKEVAEYSGSNYISVSSALGQIPIDETEGTINLLDDTEKSEILHLPSDKAVIEKDKIITLDLKGHHYYGSLKIQGKLILRNTIEKSVLQKAASLLNSLFGIVTVNAEDGDTGEFTLDGGSIEIQNSVTEEDLREIDVKGHTASITSTDAEAETVTTYYAKVEDAISAANTIVEESAVGGETSAEVTVTLTNPAVLTEGAEMKSGVTLDLAGNSLGTDGSEGVKLSGTEGSTVISTKDGTETEAVIAEEVLSSTAAPQIEGTKIQQIKTEAIEIPYKVEENQTYPYDGEVPSLELTATESTEGYRTVQVAGGENEVGKHTYAVEVYYQNVYVKTLKGTVEILPKVIDVGDVKLENDHFCPDEKAHNLVVEWPDGEMPDGLVVSYTSEKADAGTYPVKAIISLQDDKNYQLKHNGNVVDDVVLEAEMRISHTPGEETSEVTEKATCYKEGKKVFKTVCEDCGDVLNKREVSIAKTDHTKAEESVALNRVEPTCKEKGRYEEVYYCSECEKQGTKTIVDSKVVEIPATGEHTYDTTGKVTKEPTCVKEGVKTFTCKVCGDEKTEPIPATGKHTEVKDAAVAATTSAAGKTAGSHCSVCGQVLTAQKSIANIGSLTLSSKSFTYNGKAQKPQVTVKDAAGKAIAASSYTVKYSAGCTNAGSYKATVTFKGSYSGTLSGTFTIAKAKPTVKVKTASKKLKLKKVKKKKQTFAIGASVTGNGKLSYKISKYKGKAKKYIKINKSNGKITVKKGTPKGTYTVTVQVTAAASTNYNAATLSKNIKVVVK